MSEILVVIDPTDPQILRSCYGRDAPRDVRKGNY
jgi:hypothetical protein